MWFGSYNPRLVYGMPDDRLWVLHKIYIVIGKNGIYVSCAPHRGDMPMSLSKRPTLERFSSYMVAATLLIAVITASLLGSGCIGGGGDGDDAQQSMKLQIAGSTTVLPIAEECARVFMEQRPGDRVFVSGGGSSHGVKAVADGTMGIGTASRDLTDYEMEAHPDLAVHAIARDGIAIVVHPENPVDSLTMEELQGIYTGEITNWKDVVGVDLRIMVVSREEGSGTRGDLILFSSEPSSGMALPNSSIMHLVKSFSSTSLFKRAISMRSGKNSSRGFSNRIPFCSMNS